MRSAPFLEPDPSGGVLGPSLAGKRPKTDHNFNADFSFLLRPLVSFACLHEDLPDGSGSPAGGARRPPPNAEIDKYFAKLKPGWPNLRGSMAIRNSDFGPVFGRFSAKLGPKTPLERRGSSCSASCTKNQPRRPILRPFRGSSEF